MGLFLLRTTEGSPLPPNVLPTQEHKTIELQRKLGFWQPYLSLRIIEVSRDCDDSVFCRMSQVVFYEGKKHIY